jgi:hypothetical protein
VSRAKPPAVRSVVQPNADEEEVIHRRVRPFVDADRPLILLLSEAYLQGLRDAVQCYEAHR